MEERRGTWLNVLNRKRINYQRDNEAHCGRSWQTIRGCDDYTIGDRVSHARTIVSLSLFREDRAESDKLSRLREESSRVDVNLVGRWSFVNE